MYQDHTKHYQRGTSLPLLCVLTLFVFASQVTAQKPDRPAEPSCNDPQGILKISTEEVRIPVFAFDQRGRFDPTVSADDLLVREDGIAQQVTRVYRVPAYVLVLMDTGGELNPQKTVRLTGSVAAGLISELAPEDWVALMQVNSKVELIKEWSRDRSAITDALRTKLLPTKRTYLAEGLARASNYLQRVPFGDRHLVIISDGHDDSGGRVELTDALKDLAAAGITVHVISYTSLTRKAKPITSAKAHSNVPEEIAITLPAMRSPSTYTPDMKDLVRARGAWAIDLERLFRGNRDNKKEMAQRQVEFDQLADETSGVAWLPVTVEEMLAQAAAAAHVIDSQYVVTYKPQRRLAEAKTGEYRKLDVISRRVGLYVRSRRGYVVNPGR